MKEQCGKTRWEEFPAIRAIRAAVGRLDHGWEDTACLQVKAGGHVLISSDHMGAEHAYPGEDVRSLVRRGIFEAFSDLAASGAEPVGLQIDVRAPDDFTAGDFRAIGLAVDDALAVTGGLLLQGSNLSRGEFGVSSTVLGVCDASRGPLRRHGARPGDLIVVSGPFGGWDGALALLNAAAADRLTDEEWETLLAEFLHYRPELAAGAALLSTGLVSACLDCNDSLAKSLIDLSYACGHRVEIDLIHVPVAPSARYAEALGIASLQRTVLFGIAGDDRLLFTVPPADAEEVSDAVFRRTGRRPVTVGRVTAQAGVGAVVRNRDGTGTNLRRDQPATVYLPGFSPGQRRLGLTAYPSAGRRFAPQRSAS
ncbi:thiamine-phosphate kinase [Streptomyces erythrochromogenes]|uniref:thiamine-phosphate kinase n=1 Tax=Streptomyces erythrochromogenes TaxID=285574 RepID=UPI0036788662